VLKGGAVPQRGEEQGRCQWNASKLVSPRPEEYKLKTNLSIFFFNFPLTSQATPPEQKQLFQ
jgi:hypothetical protein